MPKPGSRSSDRPAFSPGLFLARILFRLWHFVWPHPGLQVGQPYVIDGIEYERVKVIDRATGEEVPAIAVGYRGTWAKIYVLDIDGRIVFDRSALPLTKVIPGPFDVIGLDPKERRLPPPCMAETTTRERYRDCR